MNRTKIEWVKNPDGTQGYTWNPITGCLNGCEYCYARKLANGRLEQRYLANTNIAPTSLPYNIQTILALADPFYPRFWSDRCNRTGMVMGKSPKGIFVCDMSDLFGIGIPEDWAHRVLDRCRDMCLHRFYLLTKQPQNLIKFSPFPENCWVGVTCTDTNMFAQSLIKMQGLKASIKYISFEPLLEWNWNNTYQEPLELVLKAEGINWVIIGAQTKPYKPPKIEWVEEIVNACDKAGIPVFLKDNLRPLFTDWTLPEWARYGQRNKDHPLQLRQAMPEGR